MANCTLADFDIMIKGASAPYSITARYGIYTANGDFAPSILDPEWHKAYQTLANSMITPDAYALMAVGSRLWDTLMQGAVRELWIAARADIEQERVEGLRLRLDLQPPSVAALPWESLYDPDRGVIFAAHPHFALVRVATIYRHVGPSRRLQVPLPLRVLIAAPDDPTNAIDSEREIAEICQIMKNLGTGSDGNDLVQVEKLTGTFTITDLRIKLAKVKPAILHFIGHGEPDGLRLWQRGRPVLCPAQSLRAVMERSPSVKLAFLNSCLAARPVGPHPFAGVAAQLLQAGVPAIIAMQYAIRDDAAIDFAHFLYEELIGGPCPGAIDLAMSAARSGLYAANPGDFSFGTPVLWLNSGNGTIFSFIPNPGDGEVQSVVTPPLPIRPPNLDMEAEGQWIDTMVATTDVEQLPADFYFLRSKWINLVEELRSLLYQLAALVKQPDSTIYTEKVIEYRRYKAALLRVKRLIEDANKS
jgi:hypothetical protein